MQQLQLHRCSQRHASIRSSRRARPFVSAVRASASAESQHGPEPARLQEGSSRREALLSMLSVPLVASQLVSAVQPAQAFVAPPAGYRLLNDKLDGYSFVCPEQWLVVTSSGNDIFLRNPRNVEENLFVDLTSPSSSRFKTVEDLGTPQDAANRLLDQYLTKEFMSTRLGIARYGEVVSAVSRKADDGRTYYDIAIRMTSYGSTNAYAASREEVLASYKLEFDRTLFSTLGTANNRLYTLRLQAPTKSFKGDSGALRTISESFRVREVDPS
ncbi:hypothetical protein HYH03_003995 [Edaphochlamys debaryana]|uniref:PsbP C-terminal domain-containing protein n=1 Tax=Edaphochlamys debaryana TaxID=47281 RepID=A0A835YGG4_9CHLO|nr:hypothetical protein HYH03_003995 [Edaphochlamys debaryana]|eukprot:KAG2498245.1 hypothetical protein HYH03_003995 [Edaphochlamys debaryana]